MKLNDDLPKWISIPLRLLLYVFVMFILVNIALVIIQRNIAENSEGCLAAVSGKGAALDLSKKMVACLREKNSALENFMMRSTFSIVDALPAVPGEFVGTWDATQPNCHYQHKLEPNGTFASEPKGCNLSSDNFQGAWGVVDGQMVWMTNEPFRWPPDINRIHVVDNNQFWLTERDGSQTKFVRVDAAAQANPQGALPAAAASAAVSAAQVTEILKASEVVVEEDPKPVWKEIKLAYEASDPAAPLEVGVISSLGGTGNFVLPVMSIPLHPEQFPGGANHREGSMSVYWMMERIAMPEPDENGQYSFENYDQEATRRSELVVAEANAMSSMPRIWIDADGAKFETGDAATRDDGVVGGALGFELKSGGSVDKQKNKRKGLSGPVVLSRKAGFPPARIVQQAEWKAWPEFVDELKQWSERQSAQCDNKKACEKAAAALISPGNIKGAAYEYDLSDGSKLRYIRAGSHGKKAVLEKCTVDCTGHQQPDELSINLWLLTGKDGTTTILHGNGYLDSIGLVDHYCFSQCSTAWTSTPQVVSWKDKSYIVGAYGGGTLYGYLVLEVSPKGLNYIGRFAWGS